MNAWTPAAYVRRYAGTSSLIHNPSKGLMELRGPCIAWTISFSRSAAFFSFFSIFKLRPAPSCFRARDEGGPLVLPETLHLSRSIV